MTTFYNDTTNAELLLTQGEANSDQLEFKAQQEWDAAYAFGTSVVFEEDEDTPPAGTTVYCIETMLKDDYDDEGIPHVYNSQLWSDGELSRNEANEFLTTLNPDLILMSFVQRGNYDEF
ncbi:MAG: hypothetical protein WBA13_01360 [Microcoleaceae cyanobacterium]